MTAHIDEWQKEPGRIGRWRPVFDGISVTRSGQQIVVRATRGDDDLVLVLDSGAARHLGQEMIAAAGGVQPVTGGVTE